MGRMKGQLDLFAAPAKRPRVSSPVAPRTAAEKQLVAALEDAAQPRARYSSARIRRLMTPLPRITVLDPPRRQRRRR